MKIINFAIIGLGRIGSIHLENMIDNENINVECISDTNTTKLNFFKKKYNLNVCENINRDIFQNKNIDAILIATPTSSHLQLILKAIHHEKFIFCEKPIDLDLKKINKFSRLCENYEKTLQIGFNRRFDPTVECILQKSKQGLVGKIEKLIITSRDRNPPSARYIKSSGGILRDCSIHDIDLMLNFFKDDKIKEVFCYASNLFNLEIKKQKDFDTVVSLFKTKKGKICIINNSRHSAYGYDQRIEVFGNKGMIQTKNIIEKNKKEYLKNSTGKSQNYLDFFIERYSDSFKKELDVFCKSIFERKKSKVSFKDCKNALLICEALYKSIKKRKSIKIEY